MAWHGMGYFWGCHKGPTHKDEAGEGQGTGPDLPNKWARKVADVMWLILSSYCCKYMVLKIVWYDVFYDVFVTSEQLFSLHNLAYQDTQVLAARVFSILVHRHGKANLVSWSIIILGPGCGQEEATAKWLVFLPLGRGLRVALP